MTGRAEDDSDETEGRKLYRARADALAKSQIEMAKRKIKWRQVGEDGQGKNK